MATLVGHGDGDARYMILMQISEVCGVLRPPPPMGVE